MNYYIVYRRYIPALRKMPLKYLFQPWKAPLDVQEKAGCVIGNDYPKPMVNHAEVSKLNRNKMEEFKATLKDPGKHAVYYTDFCDYMYFLNVSLALSSSTFIMWPAIYHPSKWPLLLSRNQCLVRFPRN